MQKVLIVDNDLETVNILVLFLEQNGFKTITADSYKTILPLIYNDKPDIIILDVLLENEDGRNICLQLKNTERTKNIGIILLSAYHDKLIGYDSYKANGIIEKPFDFEELLAEIKKCIQ